MEQTTVTDQPVVTKTLASEFKKKEAGGLTKESADKLKAENIPMEKEPVLTQPGLGVTTTTITTITQTGGDWTTGLFDICADKTTCIVGAFVPCCLEMSLAHQYGECSGLPFLPGSTFAIRSGIRERYKIRGNLCDDRTVACCCYPLAVCQMTRELKRRTKSQIYQVSTVLECS